MSPRWRHILRRMWFVGGGIVAVLAIALAVLMALGQLLVPLVARYPDRVAAFVSQQVGRPVTFASMQGYWQPSGPLLVLHDVRIGERNGEPALVLPTARVKLDFGALVEPHRHWVNLRLSGLRLTLRRDAAGHWRVAGFGVAGNGRTQHITLDDLPGNVWLDDLQLVIEDAGSGHRYEVRAGPLRLSNGGGKLRFAGELRRGSSDHVLNVAGEVRDGGTAGRLYVGAQDVDLGSMFAEASAAGYGIRSGQGDLALWLTWNERRVTGAVADVDLTDVALQGPSETVHAPRLRGLLRYRRRGDAAHLLVAPGISGAMRVAIRGLGGDVQVALSARDFDPGSWLALAALAPGLSPATAQWLATAAPGVHLAAASGEWSRQRGLRQLAVRFDHLHFAAAAGRPGVSNVHGVVRGDDEALSLALPAQPLTLDLPRIFAQPLVLTSTGGNVALWRVQHAWHVATDGVSFQGKGIAGSARGSIRVPVGGGAPRLNLYASLAHADVKNVEKFLPAGVMSKSTLQWLDHGLLGGTLDHARVVLHGDMTDWPFSARQGRFEADADISGLAIAYQPHWPHATGVTVAARFINNGMQAVATAGEVHGIQVEHAEATIADFSHPELDLKAHGKGAGKDMLDFVRTSPIGKPHADVLDQLQLDGNADFQFSMHVPLSRAVDAPLTLGGRVNLHDATVDASAWGLHMDAMNGTVAFDQNGFSMHGLDAVFRGQPVTLDMEMGPQTGHPTWPLKVEMRGRFSLAELVRGRENLAMLDKISSGRARFRIGFHLDSNAANAMHSHQVLTVHSDLRGIHLNLPAPMDKPAQALWPLNVELGFPVSGGHLRVIVGNRLYARARLPSEQQPLAVDVRFGGMAPAGAMPASGIRVRGRAADLDVSGWVRRALSAAGGVGGTLPALDVDVMADNTQIFSRSFNKLHIKLQQTSRQLAVAIDSPAIQGTVTVPVHDIDKRGIVARFDRMYWPGPGEKSVSVDAPTHSTPPPAPPPQQAANVGVAPSSLPPLHVWVGDLRFGDAHLGQVRLESWPTLKGMHIGILRAQSDSMNINATGDWNGTATDSHTHLQLAFDAVSLGQMLDAFGYEGIITGAETHARFDANWPGAPSSFVLANVGGTLSVNIGEGRILEVTPGFGRVFALLSVAAIPRRLTLDFGDVFGKGFGFNSMQGHFRFQDGNAWTKDFTVESSVATIKVTGRVGFRAHDFDQYVIANPHIGNSLPIVGAVIGGPVGAAVGLAVQGMLGKGINHAASKRYHISGPWDHPKVTPLDDHDAAPAQAPALPATVPIPAQSASIAVPTPPSAASVPPRQLPAPAASVP